MRCRTRRGSIPAWAGETFNSDPKSPMKGVYPRVGGGNAARKVLRKEYTGLSPRGRGKRRIRVELDFQLRSIPAWAGETHGGKSGYGKDEVYPRVGGGNSI